jgi:hypothetical protein
MRNICERGATLLWFIMPVIIVARVTADRAAGVAMDAEDKVPLSDLELAVLIIKGMASYVGHCILWVLCGC